MKNALKSMVCLIALATFATVSVAATITTTQNGTFDVGTTWVGGVAPASGTDSVVIAHSLNLFSEFTIASGETMTNTAGGGMRIGNNGHLTVATGGSMNLPGFDMPESGAGGHLTIEAGATARLDRYWNDEGIPAYVNEWIADASGVTTFQIDGSFLLRGTSSILEVDLTDYDLLNGATLVLVDYGSLGYQSGTGFGTVNIRGGYTGTIDYAYDQGSGDLGIALILDIALWDGGGGDGSWNTAANWDPDGVPGNDVDIYIDGADVTIDAGYYYQTQTITLTGNSSLGSVGVPNVVTRWVFGPTFNVESGSDLEANGAFWDMRGVTINMDSGCDVSIGTWEPKMNGADGLTCTFNLDAAGFETISTGRFQHRLDPAGDYTDYTWNVDFTDYTGGLGKTIILLDFAQNTAITGGDGMSAANFQEGSLNMLNAEGSYAESTLSWDEPTRSIVLTIPPAQGTVISIQ